ncbi:PucR family transcriptional regulator [Fusibacter sp. 3D3]|uniref:PucR family transcriptional regulator n=1 Tax=Fusibacter sp. 3D3 TaxID=1048380 RepID=UPI00085307B6|nr:PucR family transcriptional regulator [Fusibacter sp. 3D3]GAU77091.1 transcriptional regulator CdaR [Fusibacter sp. 3D3]
MQNNIGVKISEILQLDLFKDAEIIGGKMGLEHYITKVNVMEVPDIINWVKPGEFLLTTAYSIKDDIMKLNELIPIMKEIGVAGIGIKTKRYVDELPSSVIDTANKLAFPIINIPQGISFGDIITTILTSVVNKQTNLLIQIDDFNNRLKEIMLRGGDLFEIAKMIHEVVDAPIAITEDIFKDYVIVTNADQKKIIEPLVEELVLNRITKHNKVIRDFGIEHFEDHFEDEIVDRLMIPIFSADVLYGHVIIWNINKNIADTTLFMIEAAVSLIALNSAKKLSVYENENKHKIEFIEELLSDQEGHHLRAIEKATYFDFNKNNIYGVVLVTINETATDVKYTPNNSKILKQLNSKLISVVERLHRHYKGELIYGNKSDRIIFLLGFDYLRDESQMKQELIRFSQDLLDFSKLENIHHKISIGIGRTYGNYKELHNSYREAHRAIQKLNLSEHAVQKPALDLYEKIMHFDDLGIYRILSNEAIQPELYQFFMETLGPIVAYDKEKDADLLQTLKMYFACGCNLKKVSEEMYTHYNTVIYRMQRIKEIGNIDFNDPNVTLNIHIALKILDVLSPEFGIKG